MMRVIATALLVAWLAVLGARSLSADSAMSLLVERPPHSLRGESIDLDDFWNSARLLAHFGENTRAYEILRRRPSKSVLDLQIERFEARLLTEIGLYRRADSLLALQPYVDDGRAYYLHYLQRARLNIMVGGYERSLAFLRLLDGLDYPALEPYRDLLTVEALLRTGRPNEACDAAEKRLSEGIPLSLTPAFEQRLLEGYLNSGEHADALEFIRILKAKRSQRALLSPILAREVEVLFILADTLGAVSAALDLTKTSATRSAGNDAIGDIAKKVSVERLTDDVLVEFSTVLIRTGRLVDAERFVAALKKRTLDGPHEEQRRLVVAKLYYKERRYSKAYGQLENEFEDTSLERTAKLVRARIYRKTGQFLRSARAYEEYAASYPYAPKAVEALYVASDFYARSGDSKNAAEVLNRIIETYPSHRYSRLSTLKIVSYAVERGEYTKAGRILERSLERSGRSDTALLYQLADVYGKKGRPEKKAKVLEEIKAVNPVSFYLDPDVPKAFSQPVILSTGSTALRGGGGLLEFLKTVFEGRERACENIRSVLSPVEDPAILQRAAVYVERGRAFLQMGFRDWAESEFRVLESGGRLPARINLELGVLYDDFAMPWKSVRAFQRVYYSLRKDVRRDLDKNFKILIYPVPFPALVFENCSRYQMTPQLIYAMMREESRFDQKAVSRAGAMGLMQIMPATGEQVADELGFPEGIHNDLLSPEINVTFGVWYASNLLEQSNENTAMMLSAYNAGFGNAKRWFGNGTTSRSPIQLVEGIDYRETREYVKRIVESAHVYHAFYFSPDLNIGHPGN